MDSRAIDQSRVVGQARDRVERGQLGFAVLGPKALPKDIVSRWNKEIDRIVQLPDVKERLAVEGMEPAGGSPERFGEVLKRDVAKWQKVIKIANIKPGN